MEWVRLQGPFRVGSQVVMKPIGQDPITSVIVEASENRVDADQTDLGDAEFFGAEAAEVTSLLQRVLGQRLPRDRAPAPAGGSA